MYICYVGGEKVLLLLLVDGVCLFVCVDRCCLLMVYVYLFVLVVWVG
jgi:hypothetical protein